MDRINFCLHSVSYMGDKTLSRATEAVAPCCIALENIPRYEIRSGKPHTLDIDHGRVRGG